MIQINRWAKVAAMAGIVMATGAVAAAQQATPGAQQATPGAQQATIPAQQATTAQPMTTPAQPVQDSPKITIGSAQIPLSQIIPLNQIQSIKFLDGNRVDVTTTGGQVITIGTAPATTPLSPQGTANQPNPWRDLTLQDWTRIQEDLQNMRAYNAGQPMDLLRPAMIDKANQQAARYMGIELKDLDPYTARNLESLVDSVLRLPARGVPSPSPRPGSGSSGYNPYPYSTPSDRDGEYRCECAYCHYTHVAGTCSLPYPPSCPPSLPTVPTVASYTVMPYYMFSYAPRHHFLHGLFCPCAWCRGRW
jgi:hypothetical protein